VGIGQVIPGWDEGIFLKKGAGARLVIPSHLRLMEHKVQEELFLLMQL